MAEFKKQYNPNRNSDWNYRGLKWRLSRSKIELFTECPRCFYLDNKLGTARPRGPAFTLNNAVDALLKKEFDAYRAAGTAHPLMQTYGIDAVPFTHPQLATWRENFEGVEYHDPETGLTISGAIDDVWQGTDGKLIVVDYKATSKEGSIDSMSKVSWGDGYTRQLGIYQWLLRKNGFEVSDTAYLVYANAKDDKKAFDGQLEFEVTLVPCTADTTWIESVLSEIKQTLESESIPKSGAGCEFCPYRDAAGKKLLELHRKGRTHLIQE
jgi:CRISPR/Cas system-associated exonuclease Cas4 (RecB family)